MHGKRRQNEGLLGKEASPKVTEEEKQKRSFQKSGKGWALGRGDACFNFAHGYHTFNCTVKKKRIVAHGVRCRGPSRRGKESVLRAW